MINIKYILPLFNGKSVSTAHYSLNEPGLHPIIIADENIEDNYGKDTGNITRIRKGWNVILYETATGEAIATDILKGDAPKCPMARMSGYPDETFNYYI